MRCCHLSFFFAGGCCYTHTLFERLFQAFLFTLFPLHTLFGDDQKTSIEQSYEALSFIRITQLLSFFLDCFGLSSFLEVEKTSIEQSYEALSFIRITQFFAFFLSLPLLNIYSSNERKNSTTRMVSGSHVQEAPRILSFFLRFSTFRFGSFVCKTAFCSLISSNEGSPKRKMTEKIHPPRWFPAATYKRPLGF